MLAGVFNMGGAAVANYVSILERQSMSAGLSHTAAPKGGVAPVSKKVMNLAHFLRQAARRHGNDIGFVWGERTWTWAELDLRVDAIACALTACGVTKGDRVLVQSKNCNQLFEVHVRLFPPRRGLGADQLPPVASRGRLSRPGERRVGDDLRQRLS